MDEKKGNDMCPFCRLKNLSNKGKLVLTLAFVLTVAIQIVLLVHHLR